MEIHESTSPMAIATIDWSSALLFFKFLIDCL